MGLDAGKESQAAFAETVKESKTILWNGPAGVFEMEAFKKGSTALLDACIEAAKGGATVIVGGGGMSGILALVLWIAYLVLFSFRHCYPRRSGWKGRPALPRLDRRWCQVRPSFPIPSRGSEVLMRLCCAVWSCSRARSFPVSRLSRASRGK
jgi:hypothetical protein